jgi:hypothetical protein
VRVQLERALVRIDRFVGLLTRFEIQSLALELARLDSLAHERGERPILRTHLGEDVVAQCRQSRHRIHRNAAASSRRFFVSEPGMIALVHRGGAGNLAQRGIRGEIIRQERDRIFDPRILQARASNCMPRSDSAIERDPRSGAAPFPEAEDLHPEWTTLALGEKRWRTSRRES